MSRFTAHLGLRLAERADGAPELTADGRCCWVVAAPLTYEVGALGSGETITVPSGATTDLASIPRLAWSIGYPPDGPWLKAAVVDPHLLRSSNASAGSDPEGRRLCLGAAVLRRVERSWDVLSEVGSHVVWPVRGG